MERRKVKFKDISISSKVKLDYVETLIKGFRYQEAEEHMSIVEELFEQLESAIDPDNSVHRTIVQKRRIQIDSLFGKIQDGLQRREVGKKEDGNIAFKCNWNDKGYKGICSDDVYQTNRRSLRSQCARSDCREHVGKPPPIDECCYECQALRIFKFGAGWDHDKRGNAVKPRHIWDARKGRIAILTTIPPWTSGRLVVGAFQIQEVKDDPGRETYIYGDGATALDDMLDYSIDFWRYHKNPRKPESKAWGQGLFRYISDVAMLGMLEEYISKKGEKGGATTKAEELVKVLKDG